MSCLLTDVWIHLTQRMWVPTRPYSWREFRKMSDLDRQWTRNATDYM